MVPSTTEMLFEIGGGDRVVGVSNYDHFPPDVEKLPRVGGLIDPNVERLLSLRPDLVIVHFWHIPWPNREAFRACPWQDEILDGLLGNDLLSFHVQDHCNNFLETVDRSTESHVYLL